MSLTKLALLYGGKSGEHEVSLLSAASIFHNLDSSKYQIIPIGMCKDGQCYLNDYEEFKNYKDFLPVSTKKSIIIDSLIKNGKLSLDVDVIFPIAHGPLYEDGTFQGLLRLANSAYIGCDVLSSAIGMDKDIARRLVVNNEIKSAKYHVIPWYMSAEQIQDDCIKIAHELGWPLFVKPCSLGSSVGIHKVNNQEQLLNAIADARQYDETVMVEQYIKGREIELAVLENISSPNEPHISVPGEIKVNHNDGFYSYLAKYEESNKIGLEIPASLNNQLIEKLRNIASEIFLNLKCSGMARVDFFVDDVNNKIYFNEINTIPGFTTSSMYPKLFQASGISYPQLLDQLIQLALRNHKRRQHLVTHYQ